MIVDIVISRNLKDGGEIEVFLFCVTSLGGGFNENDVMGGGSQIS